MQALDEEDVAHLDAMEEQRREVEGRVKSGIEREVALFHAAREDRGLVQTVVLQDNQGGDSDDKNKTIGGENAAITAAVPATKKQIVPKFTIKKKRKRVDAESTNNNYDGTAQKKSSGAAEIPKSKDENKDGEKKEPFETTEKPKSNNNVADLLGLGCYGSDSDSD